MQSSPRLLMYPMFAGCEGLHHLWVVLGFDGHMDCAGVVGGNVFCGGQLCYAGERPGGEDGTPLDSRRRARHRLLRESFIDTCSDIQRTQGVWKRLHWDYHTELHDGILLPRDTMFSSVLRELASVPCTYTYPCYCAAVRFPMPYGIPIACKPWTRPSRVVLVANGRHTSSAQPSMGGRVTAFYTSVAWCCDQQPAALPVLVTDDDDRDIENKSDPDRRQAAPLASVVLR